MGLASSRSRLLYPGATGVCVCVYGCMCVSGMIDRVTWLGGRDGWEAKTGTE